MPGRMPTAGEKVLVYYHKGLWSPRHGIQSCVMCGKSDRQHVARGYCVACYQQYRKGRGLANQSREYYLDALLTVAQAAYVAGILDGEGTIGISRKVDHTGSKGGVCYRPHVSVSNTNRGLLDWLQTTTGVGHVRAASPGTERQKPAWCWHVWSQKAAAVLRVVRPYLLIKDKQADVLIRFAEQASRIPGRIGLTVEEWEYRVDTYETLRALNKRGA